MIRYNFNEYSQAGRWRSGNNQRWLYVGGRGPGTSAALARTSAEATRHDHSHCSSTSCNSTTCQVAISRTQSNPSQCQLCRTHLAQMMQQSASTAPPSHSRTPNSSLLSMRTSSSVLRVWTILYLFTYTSLTNHKSTDQLSSYIPLFLIELNWSYSPIFIFFHQN